LCVEKSGSHFRVARISETVKRVEVWTQHTHLNSLNSYNWPFETSHDADVVTGENDSGTPALEFWTISMRKFRAKTLITVWRQWLLETCTWKAEKRLCS